MTDEELNAVLEPPTPAASARLSRYRSAVLAACTTGSCRTGKFTELAMKHLSWAWWCSAAAFSVMIRAGPVDAGAHAAGRDIGQNLD